MSETDQTKSEGIVAQATYMVHEDGSMTPIGVALTGLPHQRRESARKAIIVGEKVPVSKTKEIEKKVI